MKRSVDVDYKSDKFKIVNFTGLVADSQKSRDSHVSGHIDTDVYSGRTFGSISSYITTNHDFFLVDDYGVEMSFRLKNFDFPLRPGHNLTVFWVVPDGENEGTYFSAFNHNTKEWHSISTIGLFRGLYLKWFSGFANKKSRKMNGSVFWVTMILTVILGIVLKILRPEIASFEYYIIFFFFLSFVWPVVWFVNIFKAYNNLDIFKKFLQKRAVDCMNIVNN